MNDQQRMLSEMAGSLFGELGSSAVVETGWKAIEEVALPALLLGEESGGFGGSWEDALIVFRLAGYHAVSLPIIEATIAASLAGTTEGRGTIASASHGGIIEGRFSGTVSGVPWAEGSKFVAAPAPDGGSIIIELAGATISHGQGLSGEPRDLVQVEGAAVRRIEADVFAIGALARVAQIAGALDAALEKSVAYANERQQFGRPLAKFQAVQQNLATFACEAAAANCAAMGAAQAMSRKFAPFEIAVAKLRANRAVGVGTAIAHQVHGAIGFTEEYPLHPLTRRLWEWRSEFGGDSHWASSVGARIVAAGADQFWPNLTALTD